MVPFELRTMFAAASFPAVSALIDELSGAPQRREVHRIAGLANRVFLEQPLLVRYRGWVDLLQLVDVAVVVVGRTPGTVVAVELVHRAGGDGDLGAARPGPSNRRTSCSSHRLGRCASCRP
jgi:hypothetical protein